MRNTGKRIIGFMAAMLLAFGLIPGGVLGSVRTAKAAAYELTIGGKQCIINEGGSAKIVNETPYTGVHVSLVDGNPKVTLSGATLDTGIYATIFGTDKKLLIELEGNKTNSINAPTDNGSLIYSGGGINISGPGNLILSNNTPALFWYGIHSANDLTINGAAKITINGKPDKPVHGIFTGSHNLTISEASFVAIEASIEYAVNARYGGSVTVEGGSTLIANGDRTGINAKTVTISNSLLKAKASEWESAWGAITGSVTTDKDGAGWKTLVDGEHSGDPEKLPAGTISTDTLSKYKYVEIPYPWEPEPEPEPTPAPEKTPEPEAPKAEPEKPASSAKDDDDEERDLNLPKTGDAAENGIWIAMILTGVAVMAGLAVTRKRTGRKTERE